MRNGPAWRRSWSPRSGTSMTCPAGLRGPRMTAALRGNGHKVNHKRVERLMRERGIGGITRRRRRGLTRADRKAAPSPDLVGRDFTATETGTKLVSDITYLPTLAGGGISPR
ncbi:transposase [Streptomyces sp. T1317-0309]|nr:transposase [Streptomyces sp. T1317-0309]